MIWPWTRIKQLENRIKQLEEDKRNADMKVLEHDRWRAEAFGWALRDQISLRNANKGINRLVEKIKRFKRLTFGSTS